MVDYCLAVLQINLRLFITLILDRCCLSHFCQIAAPLGLLWATRAALIWVKDLLSVSQHSWRQVCTRGPSEVQFMISNPSPPFFIFEWAKDASSLSMSKWMPAVEGAGVQDAVSDSSRCGTYLSQCNVLQFEDQQSLQERSSSAEGSQKAICGRERVTTWSNTRHPSWWGRNGADRWGRANENLENGTSAQEGPYKAAQAKQGRQKA